MKHQKAGERGGAEGQVVRIRFFMLVISVGRKESG